MGIRRPDDPRDDDRMEDVDRKRAFSHRPEWVRDAGRWQQIGVHEHAENHATGRKAEPRDRGIEEFDVPEPDYLRAGKKCPERNPCSQHSQRHCGKLSCRKRCDRISGPADSTELGTQKRDTKPGKDREPAADEPMPGKRWQEKTRMSGYSIRKGKLQRKCRVPEHKLEHRRGAEEGEDNPPPDLPVKPEEEVCERERYPDQEQDVHIHEREDPPYDCFESCGDEEDKATPDQEIPQVVLLSAPRKRNHHA